MSEEPLRSRVIGRVLTGIGHSRYSEPLFVIQGIGPGSFRQHYLTLDNGLVLDLFITAISIASYADIMMPGDTAGIAPSELVGRRVVAVVRDGRYSALVVLEGGIFMKDDDDGCYGNPLLAGRLGQHYTAAELLRLVDYWSGEPARLSGADVPRESKEADQ